MSEPNIIPCLPESAPFTPEQRAYLNGFFAGLFSRQSVPAIAGEKPTDDAPLMTLSILFGSQTGTVENLAKQLAREAGKRGFAPTIHDMAKYPSAQLASETRLLIVASTYGDGEPPDNSKIFWEFLNGSGAPKLPQTKFSICALGDTNYPKFCGFGKDLDARLAALGAECVSPRADCDVDHQETFAKWMNAALSALNNSGSQTQVHAPEIKISPDKESSAGFNRNNPFPATLLTNRKLNGEGSEKDTRHFEFLLENSGLEYEAGDALGVFPTNCSELVSEILNALKFTGEEIVAGRDAKFVSLREALLKHYEITKIPKSLLAVLANKTGDEMLKKVNHPEANGQLTAFIGNREIIDLLPAYPVSFAPEEFVSCLRKIQPRLYSISSSPKAHSGQVHLTVGMVRYESLSRPRKGVCSTFLGERTNGESRIPVFVQPNKNFRPPANPDAPMIMVGPGTGIAPFRAFLEERRMTGAKGKNWLFFGDQRAATDFIYRDELETMSRDGVLSRLDTAFSRDQTEKVYVQHRMRERAKELFAWLEDGAHFYVCGDAQRMAKDVDATLHEVIQNVGGRTMEQSSEYVNRLKAEKRYQRDVY